MLLLIILNDELPIDAKLLLSGKRTLSVLGHARTSRIAACQACISFHSGHLLSITSVMRICRSDNLPPKTIAKFPLDFPAPSRLGVVMDESRTEKIRRLFADITGCLEDTSLIAAEGQGSSIDSPSARHIVASLRQSLQKVEKQLTKVEHISKSG